MIKDRRSTRLLLLLLTLGCALLAKDASAILIFQGADPGANLGDPRPNSIAAATSYDTLASSFNTISRIDWQTVALDARPSYTPLAGVTVSVVGADQATRIVNEQTTQFGYNTSPTGGRYLRIYPQFNRTTTVIGFAFAEGVSSFGFYVTGTRPDQPGNLSVHFTDSSNHVQAISLVEPPAVNGLTGVQFWGFTDLRNSNITQVEIWDEGNRTQSRDIYGIDDIRFTRSAPVPEPSTFVTLGACSFVLLRRRMSSAP